MSAFKMNEEKSESKVSRIMPTEAATWTFWRRFDRKDEEAFNGGLKGGRSQYTSKTLD